MPAMTYEEELKQLQAAATAQLQRNMAEGQAEQQPKVLQTQKIHFLISLIRARQAQKLSQRQLAARIGMQQSAIARIESGRGNPGLYTLLKITQALGTNLSM